MTTNDVVGPFGAPVPNREIPATLKAEELSLFDSTAVAVSSVAPAYSASSTIYLLIGVAGVGLVAPAVLIVSFIPVLLIAYSYFHLNRRNPNCGASYSWLAEIVNPAFGWINGWVQIAASVLFCAQAPILAGQNTLQFLHSTLHWFSPATVASTGWQAVVATLWLALVTWICVVGIRWTTNAQWVMVLIEYTAVIVFSIGGIIKVALRHPAHSVNFSLSWFDPFKIHGFSALTGGIVLGVFFFWGWDTAVNLNEESQRASHIPGRAGIISMWLLLAVFLVNIVAVQMLLGPQAIAQQGASSLFYFGQQFAGSWASYVMLFAVLSSTVATTQTTVLPAARITLSMARDGVFPSVFARISPRFRVPVIGTLLVSAFSFGLILLTTLSSSASTVFSNLTNNIGVLIAFYYGVTGLACAWAFRKVWGQSTRSTLGLIVLPFIGGIILLFTCFQVMKAGGMAALPDILTLGSSLPLVALTWALTKGKTDFFHRPRVSYDTID